jgi:hypothetical protein
MINWRNRPIASSRQHLALLEAAVADYAAGLWLATLPHLRQWLRRVMAQIPADIGTRAVPTPEEITLSRIIGSIENLPPELAATVAPLARSISLQYGFLPSDPRAQRLERAFRDLLETNLGKYWRNLTDPDDLAKRIIDHRESGKSNSQVIRTLEAEYGVREWAAERLIRTAYTGGANAAQLESLLETGHTHKQWLTARDNRVRGGKKRSKYNHRAMDRVTVPISEPFVTPTGSRMMYPGDTSYGAPAGDISGCRCTMVGLIVEG